MRRAGTRRELHEFVERRGTELHRLAFLLARDPAGADDLLQGCLLRAWGSWSRVRRADDPATYVRRVMVNLAITQAVLARRAEVVAATPDPGALDESQTVVDRDYLVRTVRALPPCQRSAVVLRYYLDLDDATIAAALGCAPSTVRSQIHRALRTLRVRSVAGVEDDQTGRCTR